MRKIIHHLRRQPEDVRTHVLHLSTAVCGVILVLLWVYSLGTGLTSSDTGAQFSKEVAEPFSALKANLVDGYKSISESAPSIEVAE